MDNREIEKLMDKYKKEMLEFSKKNPASNYSSGCADEPDEREKAQLGAIRNGEAFQRDRRNPIAEATQEKEPETEKTVNNINSIPVSDSTAPDIINGSVSSVDIRRNLIRQCEEISKNQNSSPEQKARCAEISEFLAANKEDGMLRVEAYAAERAFGISSARVLIFLPLRSGNVTLFDGLTNINGESASIRLPAPAKSLSLSPSDGKVLPYSVYSVYIEHSGFIPAAFGNVPVFSEIESVQPVQMLAEIGEGSDPDTIVTDESNFNYL